MHQSPGMCRHRTAQIHMVSILVKAFANIGRHQPLLTDVFHAPSLCFFVGFHCACQRHGAPHFAPLLKQNFRCSHQPCAARLGTHQHHHLLRIQSASTVEHSYRIYFRLRFYHQLTRQHHLAKRAIGEALVEGRKRICISQSANRRVMTYFVA